MVWYGMVRKLFATNTSLQLRMLSAGSHTKTYKKVTITTKCNSCKNRCDFLQIIMNKKCIIEYNNNKTLIKNTQRKYMRDGNVYLYGRDKKIIERKRNEKQ